MDGAAQYGCQQLDDPRAALNNKVIFPVDERMDTGQASGKTESDSSCSGQEKLPLLGLITNSTGAPERQGYSRERIMRGRGF